MLLAVCDSMHRFTYVNIGGFGSESDGGIFRNSNLGQMLESGEFNIPDPEFVQGSEMRIPYFLLGDAAFPLKPYLMVPYSGRHLEQDKFHHNKELSCGRGLIENSFGVLAARWQVFLKPISAAPKKIDKIIKACVVLHNFLCEEIRGIYSNGAFTDHEVEGVMIDGAWRSCIPAGASLFQELPENIRTVSTNSTTTAINIRNEVKNILFTNTNL